MLGPRDEIDRLVAHAEREAMAALGLLEIDFEHRAYSDGFVTVVKTGFPMDDGRRP